MCLTHAFSEHSLKLVLLKSGPRRPSLFAIINTFSSKEDTEPSIVGWHTRFLHSVVNKLFIICRLIVPAVCQKQILIPNNSLLYCSEKCKREDALSSSPPLFYRSSSPTYVPERRPSAASSIFSSFEPSRKEQWFTPPSPTRERQSPTIQSEPPSTGTSPTSRPSCYRSGSSRPLPPLHPRSLGSSPRSMDLVLPVYKDPLISPEVTDSKSLDYGRRIVETTAATNTGGLKKLFNFKELQSGPAY